MKYQKSDGLFWCYARDENLEQCIWVTKSSITKELYCMGLEMGKWLTQSKKSNVINHRVLGKRWEKVSVMFMFESKLSQATERMKRIDIAVGVVLEWSFNTVVPRMMWGNGHFRLCYVFTVCVLPLFNAQSFRFSILPVLKSIERYLLQMGYATLGLSPL